MAARSLHKLFGRTRRDQAGAEAERRVDCPELAVPDMNSLVIEIGPGRFAAKVVVARPDPLPEAKRLIEVTVQPRRRKDGSVPEPKQVEKSVPDWEEMARYALRP
jgi:hypothetical protein